MTAYEFPDTWLDLPQPPAGNSGPGISQLRCGCLPDEACPGCNGEGIDEWRDRKDAAAAVVARWWRGEITAEQYYHLSGAVDRDGMPSREAVVAREREARRRPEHLVSGAEMEALWLRTLPQESREAWLAATRDGQEGAA